MSARGRGEPDPARSTRQSVCQQCAEAVAEEHMRTVECRSQLIVHLVHELAQRGESLAVDNLDRNYVDARAEAPCSRR